MPWEPLLLVPQEPQGLLMAAGLKAQCFLLEGPLMSQQEAYIPFLLLVPPPLILPTITPLLLHLNQSPYLNSSLISPTNFAQWSSSLC